MIVTSSQLRLMINEEIRCMVRHQYTINKINAMAHNTYGIQLTEHLSFHDQVYIMESVGFNTPCSDAVNAMTLCSIVRGGSSNGRQPINEIAILAAIPAIRGMHGSAKLFNGLAGWIAKKLGMVDYSSAIEDATGELGAACEKAGLDTTKPYCKNLGTKITAVVQKLLKTVEDKFTSLITYVAAVIKFKTLKPSEEQKTVAQPIAESILVYVNTAITLFLLGQMVALSGGVGAIVFASIFGALSITGAKKRLRALDQKPETVEEARAALEQAKEEALGAIQAEVA